MEVVSVAELSGFSLATKPYSISVSGIEEANEEIKKNMTELEEFLQNTFRMSPNAIESLINATFSKDLVSFS